jgi:hypothetical protein
MSISIKQIKQEPDILIRTHTNKNKPKQQKAKCAFVSEPKKELLPELDDDLKVWRVNLLLTLHN